MSRQQATSAPFRMLSNVYKIQFFAFFHTPMLLLLFFFHYCAEIFKQHHTASHPIFTLNFFSPSLPDIFPLQFTLVCILKHNLYAYYIFQNQNAVPIEKKITQHFEKCFLIVEEKSFIVGWVNFFLNHEFQRFLDK